MLKRVKIKNFRSLDIDVVLDPVTVLIGRSGTGKSNFVDAMRYLRDRLQPMSAQTSSVNEMNILPVGYGNQGCLEYEILFDVPPMRGDFLYYIKFDYDLYRPFNGLVQEEKLMYNAKTLFHRAGKDWPEAPFVENSCKQFSTNEVVLATLKGSQNISIAHIALSEGIGCYDFPGDVCRASNSSNCNEKTFNGLSDFGKNANFIFGDIRHDLTRLELWNRINESMRFLNDSIETIDQQSGRSGDIIVTHHFGDSSIVLDLARESEGCRRFFAYMLALYQTPPKQTMFFEEPEKGLYPVAFAALADEMKLCPEMGQGQVILTTHSPDLLNCFAPESLRGVVMKNGVTKIGPIAADQLESLREHLITPGELLMVDDARIEREILLSSGVER